MKKLLIIFHNDLQKWIKFIIFTYQKSFNNQDNIMRTISTPIYNFEDVKADKNLLAKVLEKNRYHNVQDSYWYEYTDETFESILKRIGFSDIKLSFSLSYSQGDFANFVGKFSPRKNGITAILDVFDAWLELHKVLNELQGYLTYLSNDVSFTFDGNYIQEIESEEYPSTVEAMEDDFTNVCRNLCKLYFEAIKECYEREISNEGLTEYFNNSDLEFLEDGSIFSE